MLFQLYGNKILVENTFWLRKGTRDIQVMKWKTYLLIQII